MLHSKPLILSSLLFTTAMVWLPSVIFSGMVLQKQSDVKFLEMTRDNSNVTVITSCNNNEYQTKTLITEYITYNFMTVKKQLVI